MIIELSKMVRTDQMWANLWEPHEHCASALVINISSTEGENMDLYDFLTNGFV